MMVSPAAFGFNPDTGSSNSFQTHDHRLDETSIQAKALSEFNQLAHTLKQNHVEVVVVRDTTDPIKPDAIFPNNWVCLSADGNATLFPMAAPNRRPERRMDIVEELAQKFEILKIYDWSIYEEKDQYLEGTGSMVFDHLYKVAYACVSERTHPTLFTEFCSKIGYKPILFEAYDSSKKAIYHTNVMMCIGTNIAVLCIECIAHEDRMKVLEALKSTGRELVEITLKQMLHFAGNMLEVTNQKGEKLLVMSTQALESLQPYQLQKIEQHLRIIHSNLNTIETYGGGSARCMLAEIFCPTKKLV